MEPKDRAEYIFETDFIFPPGSGEKNTPNSDRPETSRHQATGPEQHEQPKSVTQLANDFLHTHSVKIDTFAAGMWILNGYNQLLLSYLPDGHTDQHLVSLAMCAGAAIFFGTMARIEHQRKQNQNK